jgi:hypothetical protein
MLQIENKRENNNNVHMEIERVVELVGPARWVVRRPKTTVSEKVYR